MEGVCKCVHAQRHWFHRGSFHCRTRIRPATACVAACRCQARNPRRIDLVGSHQRGDAALIPSKRHRIAHLQPSIGLRQRRNAEKTAEERFHTLARGWLVYHVTSMHSQLPPKSGCRKHSRRRHCEAQNAAERVPQRGSISAAHSGISEQYRFANIPSVVR